jgi:short-subunit dehydrogenase
MAMCLNSQALVSKLVLSQRQQMKLRNIKPNLTKEARVKAIVKKINADNKKTEMRQKSAANNKEQYYKRKTSKPKFPGAK